MRVTVLYLTCSAVLTMVWGCSSDEDEAQQRDVIAFGDATTAMANSDTSVDPLDGTVPDTVPDMMEVDIDASATDMAPVVEGQPDAEIMEMPIPGEAQRPDLPMGPNDRLAQAACALMDGQFDGILAAASLDEAGQVLLTPNRARGYAVTLPDTGEGYVTLQVPDWAITIGGFLPYTSTLEILDPDFVTERILPVSWNGACPDQDRTDQRLKYHSWGSFTAVVTGPPGGVVQLAFIKDE